MRHLPFWLVVFVLLGQQVSGNEMSSEMKRRRRGGGSIKRKINRKTSFDKVGEALMEVTFKSICNTTDFNPISEFPTIVVTATNTNISDRIVGNDTANLCSACFLNNSLEEMFTSEGLNKTQTCVRQYLPNRYQVCADMMQNGNSTEEMVSCLKEGLMNSTIMNCGFSAGNTSDVVTGFRNMTECIRRNKRDFKKQVRMAMMDRAIGKEGCSFSALIALKMFGGKSKSMGKSVDWDDAFDNMLEEQLEEDDDDDDKYFTWKKKSGSKRGSIENRNGMSKSNDMDRGGRGRNQGDRNNNHGGISTFDFGIKGSQGTAENGVVNFNRGSFGNGSQRPRRPQGGNRGRNQNSFNYGRGNKGGQKGGRNNQGGFGGGQNGERRNQGGYGGGRNPPRDENSGGESDYDDDYDGEYDGDDNSSEFQ